jgi:hypothetical protein
MNILGRKRELISRDLLGEKYDSILRSWLTDRDNESLRIEKDRLEKELEEKWRIRVYISEETIRGLDDTWDISWGRYGNTYESVKDGRGSRTFLAIIDKNKVVRTKLHDYHEDHSVYCPPSKIPIIIDPTILTLNDAKFIKNKVWEIVANELIKLQNTKSKVWNPKIPQDEPIQLAKTLRCREITFKKYLRWYDLKMGGIPFRIIAMIEKNSNESSDKDNKYERIAELKRKPKIGTRVRGESAVRNGFHIIYEAIFRENPPSEEDKIQTHGQYECPDHDNDCPPDCHYLKQYMVDFENKFPDPKLKERLVVTTLEDLEKSQYFKQRKKAHQV